MKITRFRTEKYTACFRQWRAENTHCLFTHAYQIYFDIDLLVDLTPKESLKVNSFLRKTFDYKTFVAKDDPYLEDFRMLDKEGVIQLVELEQVGCERFSEFLLFALNDFAKNTLKFNNDICNRVETWEHEKNSGVCIKKSDTITYQSSKLIDGFSTCFRDYKSSDNDKFLHGTDLKFRVYFEGDLDHRNWVVDFGFLKRSNTLIEGLGVKEFFNSMFDHTCVISANDPMMNKFLELDRKGVMQVIVLSDESFYNPSEYLINILNNFLKQEYGGRITVSSIELI